MKRTLALSMLALSAGCALPENFVPEERAVALSPEGYAAADYEVMVDGNRLGDVAIWTNGAKLISTRDGSRTALYVSFQIENDADVPMQVEHESIRIRAGDRLIRPVSAEAIHGSTTVPPGGIGVLVLRYMMPKGVDPQDLDAFTIEWTARAGELAYTQRTPFREYEATAYEYPYQALPGYYYSPFDDSLHLDMP